MHQPKVATSVLAVMVVLSLLAVSIHAYPSWSRPKRVSDQRLAELQTMLAIARLKSARMPTKNGYVDVAKIGRKKRSEGLTTGMDLTDIYAEQQQQQAEENPAATDEDDETVDWRYVLGRLDRG